jgi:hypothetical protein
LDTRNPPRPKPQLRPQLTVADRVLVGTVIFQGVTGLVGGLMLITTPGEEEFLPEIYLDHIPFDSWFWPGVILAGGLGITALVIAWGLLRTPAWHWVAPIERRTGHHWSWMAAIGLGVGLMAWIVVELVLLPEWSWLQPLYLAVGAVIVATAVTPAVRGRLRHPRSEP